MFDDFERQTYKSYIIINKTKGEKHGTCIKCYFIDYHGFGCIS
jgi:hypothetical protein